MQFVADVRCGGTTKFPPIPAPSGGVKLLVAAPARKTRTAGATVSTPDVAVIVSDAMKAKHDAVGWLRPLGS